jgi:hypothetical protein
MKVVMVAGHSSMDLCKRMAIWLQRIVHHILVRPRVINAPTMNIVSHILKSRTPISLERATVIAQKRK